MQVQFNKPITLGENTYGKGQHDVPDADALGWFFDALVTDGDAVVLREAAKAEETPDAIPAGKKTK